MILVDGHWIDYPDDEESRAWRDFLVTSTGRAVERAFVNEAFELKRQGRKKSGYAILQNIRDPLPAYNTFGPMWSRLARAKHPELKPHLPIKPVGWGKSRKRYDRDDDKPSPRPIADDLPMFADDDDDDDPL